jgi:hypothetical protein
VECYRYNYLIHVFLFAIATNSKISFIPMSSLEAGAHDRNAPGVVHFVPDGDNRRGAITCLAVSSHDEGKLQLHVLCWLLRYRSDAYVSSMGRCLIRPATATS